MPSGEEENSYDVDSNSSMGKPYDWQDHECLKDFKLEFLTDKEERFFLDLIEKYLSPLRETKEHKEQAMKELDELRDKSFFCFLLLNTFWIVLLFVLILIKHKLQEKIYFQLTFANKTSFDEPVQFLFIMMCVVVLILQLIGMLWHRAVTFMQLIRNTSIKQTRKMEKASTHANGHVSAKNLGFEMSSEEVKSAYLEVQQAVIHLDDDN